MNNSFSLKDKYFWILLIFITIVSGVLFFDFIVHKRLFIFYDIGGDTRQSYWPMYHYIIEAIREGTLKSWSFQIGLGTSTFTLYSFLFDPFIILFLLLPIKYLTYGLLISAIVKIVISGVLFYLYMNLLSIKKYPAVIASLVWAFNGYMMLWGQHYWFATMLVLFTFVMLSLEMWLRGKRPFFLPISIAIMGINSPYFLFMISFFLFFYVIFHYVLTEKTFSIKMFFMRIGRFFGSYFIGLGAGAIVFLPVSYLILSSPRTSGTFFDGDILKFATYMDYISIFLRLFSNNALGVGLNYFGSINYYEGPMLSSSLLFIILLPQLFFAKVKFKNKIVWALAAGICLILLTYPFFSTLFSAFSSYNYRWNFLLIFLNVLTIGYMLQNFSQERRVSFLGFCLSAFFVIIGWYYCHKIMIFQGMIPDAYIQEKYLQRIALWVGLYLFCYVIILIYLAKSKKHCWILLLCIVSIELINFNYSTINDRLTVPIDVEKKKEGYYDYTNEAIKYIHKLDKGFFRIDKNYDSYSYNDSLFQNYNGVNSYNSLNQPSYINFVKELNLGVEDIKLVSGFEHRPALRNLIGVKYILSKDENVPNEYKKLATFGDVHVYKNLRVLPIGFTYDSYMSEEDFVKLMPFEQDSVLLRAAVLEKANNLPKYSDGNKMNSQSININSFKMLNGDVEYLKNMKDFAFISKSSDPGMSVHLPENDSGWRIEFEIQGPNNTNGEIFWATKGGKFNQEESYRFGIYKTPIKVAYELHDKNITDIRLDPGTIQGKYIIKNFNIVPVKSNDVQNVFESIKNDDVHIQEFSNSKLKGKVKVEKDGLLFFSIPYNKGWTLKIDGKEAQTVLVNMGFTGATISKGNHTVELEYHQPLLKMGIIISIFCWGIIIRKIIMTIKEREKIEG